MKKLGLVEPQVLDVESTMVQEVKEQSAALPLVKNVDIGSDIV